MKIFNYKNCTAVFSDKSDGDLNFYTYSEEQLEAIRKQLSKSLNHDIKFPVYVEQVKAYEIEIRAEMEAERRANNYHVKRAGSMAAKGYSIPKSVVKANKKSGVARI